MKLSARVLFFVGKTLPVIAAFGLLLFLYVTVPSHASIANAAGNERSTNEDVPENDHTRAQTVLIESMSAFICQLAGVDVINPDRGCLDVDQKTQKLGYVSSQENQNKLGGLLGGSTQFIGTLYTQPVSGIAYVASLREDFGIIKTANAQNPDESEDLSGFSQLAPLQGLWQAARNLTYLIFVVIFIFIGIAIMLRLKIDPRTVMSIQNQIPKVVIAILLITFSYSIVGFVIDLMWVSTYVGINTLAPQATYLNCEGIGAQPNATLQQTSYAGLLDYPIAFVNNIFKVSGKFASSSDCNAGISTLSGGVGDAIGSIVGTLVTGVITSGQVSCSLNPADPASTISGCAALAMSSIAAFFASIFAKLIALVAILVVLFRLWINLLKSYAYVIIYTILAPFWIIAGLIPGSSMGFNGWIRSIIAKLAVFPATAMLIIIARVVLDIYDSTTGPGSTAAAFIPPLIGNPQISVFGPLIAFAILLITPELTTMLDSALKAPAGKMGAAVGKGFGQGSAIVGGFIGGQVARATRFDPHKGEVGWLAGKRVQTQDAIRKKIGLAPMAVARRERADRVYNGYAKDFKPPEKILAEDGKTELHRNVWDLARSRLSRKKPTT